jgi:NAD(P)-dependent dehydrogenase (short-subunit alcohol dehydrogenase family)
VSLAGIERTVASQVVGPFLLTELLLDRLRATGPGRVITMSSGGMYAANLTVEQSATISAAAAWSESTAPLPLKALEKPGINGSI